MLGMFAGDSRTLNAYVGSNQVIAAYVGSNLVWNHGAFSAIFRTGHFSTRGYDANFISDADLTLDAGHYTLTGQAASFGRVDQLNKGSYSLTGHDLIVGFIGTLSKGSYTLTGYDANPHQLFNLDSGHYIITGYSADFNVISLSRDIVLPGVVLNAKGVARQYIVAAGLVVNEV